MICSSINATFDIEIYPKEIRDAISFFKTKDLKSHQTGEFEIEGRDIFYQVIDLKTKNRELGRPEVHNKYIDIQFLVSGEETIGFVDDNGKNQVDEDLLETRDLLFYKNVKELTYISMNEGDFCVFFPNDIHVPGLERNGESNIRKVVYKVKYDLLKSN